MTILPTQIVVHALRELCSAHGLVGADPRVLCHIDPEYPAGVQWNLYIVHERKTYLMGFGADLHLAFIDACKVIARYAKGDPDIWTKPPKTSVLFTAPTGSETDKSK